MTKEPIEGDEIAVPPKASHNPDANGGQNRDVSEFFAGVNIGEVGFDDGQFRRADGVAQSHAVVREGAGIEYDTRNHPPGLMEPIDQLALDVRLKIFDYHASLRADLPKIRHDFGEGVGAVNVGFPSAEEVQVGTVEQQYNT